MSNFKDKFISKDPSILELSPKPDGIRRVRRMPLVLGLFIFLGIIVFLIFNISNKQKKLKNVREERAEQSRVKESVQIDSGKYWFNDESFDDIRLGPTELSATESKIPSSLENSKNVIEEDIERGEEDSSTSRIFQPNHNAKIQSLNLQESAESKKLFNDALKSSATPMNFNVDNVISDFSSTDSRNGNDNLINSPIGLADNSSGQLSDQSNKQKFLRDGVLPGDYLMNQVQAPISKYELKAGSIIPAVLEGSINSDLPGNIRARIRENVYDSATGRYLLLPQGSVILGSYDSRVNFGQGRLLIVWTRIIFPDSSSLNIERLQGVDLMGKAGFHDKVDNHTFKIYSNALLLSLVGAGYEFLNKRSKTNEESTNDTVASSVGDQLGQVTSETLRKNINIQPTITIRPGYRFNVLVTKDMIIEPVRQR